MPPVEMRFSRRLLFFLLTCPWLWWLGMSESHFRRRTDDGWGIAKLLPIVIVPLLTAGFTAFITVRVLEARLDLHIEQTNRRLDTLEQRTWEYRPYQNGDQSGGYGGTREARPAHPPFR